MDIDYSWTTGGDAQLSHRKLIARGGFGDVHEVLSFRSLTY
jgi:hypothetical protein